MATEPLCEMTATGPGERSGRRPPDQSAVRSNTLMKPMLLGPHSAMPRPRSSAGFAGAIDSWGRPRRGPSRPPPKCLALQPALEPLGQRIDAVEPPVEVHEE